MPIKKYSYYELLTLLKDEKPIERIEIADSQHFFSYDPSIGAYMDWDGKFLTEFIFEKQMFSPIFIRSKR